MVQQSLVYPNLWVLQLIYNLGKMSRNTQKNCLHLPFDIKLIGKKKTQEEQIYFWYFQSILNQLIPFIPVIQTKNINYLHSCISLFYEATVKSSVTKT